MFTVSTSRGNRLAYLDWLRFLVVLFPAPFLCCHQLHRNGWLGIARDLSFSFYMLNYAPLTAVTYVLDLSIWTGWILTVAASWILVNRVKVQASAQSLMSRGLKRLSETESAFLISMP